MQQDKANPGTVCETLAGAPVVEGFPSFAPDLALENTDFPAHLFDALAKAEEESFWFAGRNRVVQQLFQRFVGVGPAQVLEVGCGTGYVLRGLAERFPAYRLVGAEVYYRGLHLAKQRVPGATFCQLDATAMPFANSFDAVGCFDVLEHIEDDVAAVRGIARALRPRGWMIATVPQHQWLWSAYDEAGHHKRRYGVEDLRKTIEAAGLRVVFTTSFVSLLLPALIWNRFQQRGHREDRSATSERAMKDLAPGKLANFVGSVSLSLENLILSMGLSLPVGGSLAVAAIKEAR